LRIVAGRWRGKGLADLGKGDPAAHLRPTTDRVRESLFNLLTNGRFGDLVTGARVLDLFAGTGALGLEALSRGAVHATFVDDGGPARALLRDNVGRLRGAGRDQGLPRDATALGDNRGQPFTLIFLDPPYGMGLGERACLRAGWRLDRPRRHNRLGGGGPAFAPGRFRAAG
jgi:16S rRNA (guanine966-N2)-methyltransferase